MPVFRPLQNVYLTSMAQIDANDKMQSSTPEIIPLTPEEAGWLMTAYNLRRKNLFFSGYFRCCLTVAVFLVVVHFLAAMIHDIFFYDPADLWLNYHTFLSGMLGEVWAVFLVAAAICTLAWYTWILPYKRDALSGLKKKMEFMVRAKEYYPVTGQHFVRINWPIDKLYEVEEQVYNQCEIGGPITMYQAIHSLYIFCKNDSIRYKLFEIKRPRGRKFDWM